MCRTQLLSGLMLLGFMGTAAAIGPGVPDRPGGQGAIGGSPPSFVASIGAEYRLDFLSSPAVAVFSPDIPQIAGQETITYKSAPDSRRAGDGLFSLGDYAAPVLGRLTVLLDHENLKPGSLVGTLGAVYGGVLQAIEPPEPRRWMTLAAAIGLVGMMIGRVRRIT